MSGLLPLGLYFLDLLDNLHRGVGADSLWMCQLANLLMGLGALLGRPYWISMGILWIIAGTPFWVREIGLDPSITASSYVAHLGGLGWALWRVRSSPRPAAWAGAWGFFVAVREACRRWTPVELNVNAAHQVRDGLEGVFADYWQYWLFTTLLCGGTLCLLDRFLKGNQGHPQAS